MEEKYMRVDKVIIRAAVSTLVAILVLFAVMVLALVFIFPSTMMQIAYNLGMDGTSVSCAKRAYAYTDETYYIAFATEVAIGSDDDEEIEACGLSFINDDKVAFEEYCAAYQQKLGNVNGEYEQYVYGQVSLAQYRQGKKAEAVETAFSGLSATFPQNNAAVILLLTAKNAGDNETLLLIDQKMQQLSSQLQTQAEREYLSRMLSLCQRDG